MWYLLIAAVLGIVYGYAAAGKQDKSNLFWKGVGLGVALAIVVGLLAWLLNINLLGLGDMGFFTIILTATFAAIAFVVGVWIGDMVEGRRHAGGPRTPRQI